MSSMIPFENMRRLLDDVENIGTLAVSFPDRCPLKSSGVRMPSHWRPMNNER